MNWSERQRYKGKIELFMANNPMPKPECPFPAHGEMWSRMALARARLRGEEKFMWHCPWYDHWHVTDQSLEQLSSGETDG